MSDLKDFQQKFMKELIGVNPFSRELKLLPVGNLNDEKLQKVYSGDYFSRLTECLGSHYEALWLVLGDEEFFGLCREYIQNHPSNYQDLLHYGELIPQFLKDHKLLKEFPFLGELALLEKNFWRLFHSSYERVSFSEDPLEDFHLKDRELIYLIHSPFKIYDLWRNREVENYLEDKSMEDFFGEQLIFLKRSKEGVDQYLLNPLQFEVIKELQSGKVLGKVMEECIGLESWEPEDWSQFFKIIGP